MKRTLIIFAALGLAACQPSATLPAVETPPAWCSATVQRSAQVMAGLELAYNVPAATYRTANENNLITPAIREKVRPLLINAYNALVTARTAYSAVDGAAAFSCAAEAIRSNTAAANALLPRN